MFKKLTFLLLCLLITISISSNAQGLFDPVVHYSTAVNPQSVCVDDLNGDTYLDIVVSSAGNFSNSYAGSVDVLLNNGDGTFTAAVNYATDGYTYRVRIADMDGVNGPDLITANMNSSAPGSISVLLNNGDGTFAAAANYAGVDRVHTVDCADFDGDTDIDVVAGFYSDNRVAIYSNNGSGVLAFSSYYTASGTASQGVCAADIDGDSNIDLAVANVNWGVSVLLNNGDGTFAAADDYSTGSNSWPADVMAIDLDGDTYLDLILPSAYGDGAMSVLLNNGDSTFASYVSYACNDDGTRIYACDLDGDDDNDVAMNGGTDSLAIYLNNGDGTFADYVNYHTDTAGGDVATGPRGLFGADLDGDDNCDLVVVNTSLNNIAVFIQSDTPVDVDDEITNGLPSNYILSDNYPNPFNPSTFIDYSLPVRSDVNISVYNILGQKITTLVDETKPAGSYQASWNGTDSNGKSVSTGIYFYILKAGDFLNTRKMILLK